MRRRAACPAAGRADRVARSGAHDSAPRSVTSRRAPRASVAARRRRASGSRSRPSAAAGLERGTRARRRLSGALGMPEADHAALAMQAVERAVGRERWEPARRGRGDAATRCARCLPERYPPLREPPPAVTDAFLAWRLDAALRAIRGPLDARAPRRCSRCRRCGRRGDAAPIADRRAHAARRPVAAMPPLARGAWCREPIERRFLRRLLRRLAGRAPPSGGRACGRRLAARATPAAAVDARRAPPPRCCSPSWC